MLFRTVVLLTLQGQFTDEGCSTCRVACDCYRGVICLTGSGQMGENHEDDADDYGACFHKAFIFLGDFFVKSAR